MYSQITLYNGEIILNLAQGERLNQRQQCVDGFLESRIDFLVSLRRLLGDLQCVSLYSRL